MNDQAGSWAGRPGLPAGAVLRVIGPGDEERIERMLARLSPASVYRRFFTLFPKVPPPLVHEMASVDHDAREGFVVALGEEVIAMANYVRLRGDPSTADLAVVVEDAWQRRGLARVLVRALARAAAAHGIERFAATILTDNPPALRLASAVAPHSYRQRDGREVHVLTPLRRADADGARGRATLRTAAAAS